ncbi:CU044_2847 family protein [Nonomuraea sp. 3N208]|uniref:CU044_2847 family protein n=1 Tax=Nonomuraea sp. 3N208 TaxID=3457421 RepID=UPI003FCF9C31
MSVSPEPLGTIKVEVLPDPGYRGTLGPADLLEKFENRAGELGASIGAVAERVRAALEERLMRQDAEAWALSEVSLALSLSLEAESGVVIAKAKTGGTFQVSLKWTRGKT